VADESAIDLAKAKLAAQKIDHSASVIQNMQVTIQGHKAHLRSGWDSSAALAFDDVFNHFDQDFAKILKALNQMHEKLVHTNIKYEQSVQDQHEAVNKVNQLINHQT
jgi:WXG100 family type VII secretion target